MTAQGSGRGRKPKPGRIMFVGAGPGDPGLLTTRARTVLANTAAVSPVTFPYSRGGPGGPEIRPALGDPAEVAKTLASEAKTGVDVVRLVAGDPLSVDAVITEVTALAKTHLDFEIVPGLPDTTAVPT